ncbi:MAG TPA: Ku protein [Candidatus Caccosoma faecigallinarum]|uniref:Non-homologous end joining protein Ku n=1 Tax=Candidatus Caccosoma faecigallinarum TaxID=2840720 RepID=A0A9D1G8E0_9FIRM|nr:probable DNA repair protein HLPCO_07209 [Firmicutes bacterium CAG:631]HIT17175.1 Ku protein [Candidatus Caccosoma faecigallinarum]
MAYSYKGSISFGFVYIPITLHASTQEHGISFHLLDKKTKSRVKYKKTCVDCKDKEIKNEDIIKGYEYEKGKYVLFDDDDFEKIKSIKEKSIVIEQFVNLDEIDPIYYQKAYYVVPTGAEKAYYLLLQAMEQENKAGLAKSIIGTKENLIIIRAKNHQMILNTLFFEDEIKSNPNQEITEKVTQAELKLAKTLIQEMTAPFKPKQYKDEYHQKIKKAIEAKIAGKKIVAVKEKAQVPIVDLMEALKNSLKQTKKPKTKKDSTSETIIPPKSKKRPSANA